MLRIEELRTEKNLTQKELAVILNVNPVTVCDWERGRTEPSIEYLIKLANIFACSVDYIISREDDFGNIQTESNLSSQEEYVLSLFKKLPETRKNNIVMQLEDTLAGIKAKNENKQL